MQLKIQSVALLRNATVLHNKYIQKILYNPDISNLL